MSAVISELRFLQNATRSEKETQIGHPSTAVPWKSDYLDNTTVRKSLMLEIFIDIFPINKLSILGPLV